MKLEPLAPALGEGEIRAFEAGARLKLPPGLREFYLAQNGGLPEAPLAVLGASDIEFFCPLVPAPRTGVPGVDCEGDVVWFARDTATGRYGVLHRGADFGQVVWAVGRGPAVAIAARFADFMAGLGPAS